MSNANKSLICTLIFLVYEFCISASVIAEPISDLRLQKLEQALEQQLKLYNIPGMAIAVVHDNETILLRGFGLKNIEQQLPVAATTIFPIGSISKPFTSLLAGIRVDEGVIDWDDQIVNYLPAYKFTQDGKTLPLSLMDTLTHRSGYGRNDTLWSNPNTSRAEIIKAAPNALPLAPYKSEYHYNNTMYLAAGMATAHDVLFDWDKVLQEKLLTPLDMANTTADYNAVKNSKALSTGYYWDEIEKDFSQLPLISLDNIAPAGGIYSNAVDMAKWLRFLLHNGATDGNELIKPETLKEIFSPKVVISNTYSYGIGWNISQYNDERLIGHAGSIEGYSAQLAFLPDSRIGFALLMNVSITPLQLSSINLVFDTLLGELSDTNKQQNENEYAKYVGDYVGNFFHFENDTFSFKVQGGTPALNVPGQTLYILKAPDKEGKLYFEVTNNVAIAFNVDENNNIIGMTFYEEGEAFFLPKKETDNSQQTELKKQADAQTLSKLMDKKRYQDVLGRLGELEIHGTLFQAQSGVSGQFVMKISEGLNWSIHQDYGQFGHVKTVVTEEGGINERLRHSFQLKGKYHEQALREHPLNFIFWDKIYKSISIESIDKAQLKVSLEGFETAPATAIVDRKTSNATKIEMTFSDPVWGDFSRSISYSNYEKVLGLNIPNRIEINDHETGITTLNVTNIICEACQLEQLKTVQPLR